MDAPERFHKYLDIDNSPASCWEWKGGKSWNGYGHFWLDGKTVLSHRYSYELYVGPIPVGLVMDHLCRTRDCVNPLHIEPVTPLVSARERIQGGGGGSSGAYQLAKTHCPQGHPYSGDNLVVRGGSRRCRKCISEHKKATYAHNRAFGLSVAESRGRRR